jgi:hypothetical protein
MRRTLIASLLCIGTAAPAVADEPTSYGAEGARREGAEVQNSLRNEDANAARARLGERLTADDQSTRVDRTETIRKIRELIVDDETLSTSGKNVKIVTTDDGMVTLIGVVADNNEKYRIAELAKGVAGNSNVRNQLVIKLEN